MPLPITIILVLLKNQRFKQTLEARQESLKLNSQTLMIDKTDLKLFNNDLEKIEW